MKTKQSKNLLAVGAVLILCIIMIVFSGSIIGSQKSYDVKPEITLPESRTDTARVIDAYERMMDRFIDLTDKNLTGINTDVKGITQRLVLIDCKLTELSKRMAGIEKALGIEQDEKQAPKSENIEESNVAATNKSDVQSKK